jgi:hypothetical protein
MTGVVECLIELVHRCRLTSPHRQIRMSSGIIADSGHLAVGMGPRRRNTTRNEYRQCTSQLTIVYVIGGLDPLQASICSSVSESRSILPMSLTQHCCS